MNAFALFAFLCGAVLAFRFKVFVLYPVIGLGAIVALVLGLAAGVASRGNPSRHCRLRSRIQIGYLFGGLVRATVIAARLAARRRQIGTPSAGRRRPDPATLRGRATGAPIHFHACLRTSPRAKLRAKRGTTAWDFSTTKCA